MPNHTKDQNMPAVKKKPSDGDTVTIKKKEERDVLFAPLASWSKFRRLHAYLIDHKPHCTHQTPRDAEDASFRVNAIKLSKDQEDVFYRVKAMLPNAVVCIREHVATCRHCNASLARTGMLVSVPVVESDGEMTKRSREYAL